MKKRKAVIILFTLVGIYCLLINCKYEDNVSSKTYTTSEVSPEAKLVSKWQEVSDVTSLDTKVGIEFKSRNFSGIGNYNQIYCASSGTSSNWYEYSSEAKKGTYVLNHNIIFLSASNGDEYQLNYSFINDKLQMVYFYPQWLKSYTKDFNRLIVITEPDPV